MQDNSNLPRIGSGKLSEDSTSKLKDKVVTRDKYEQITGNKPLHRKKWFRNTVRTLGALTALGVGTAIHQLDQLRDRNHEKMNEQKRNLERFTQSPQFNEFNQQFEQYLVWTFDYIQKQHEQARDLLPEVRRYEEVNSKLDWIAMLPSLNPQTYTNNTLPSQTRTMARILHQRGHKIDADNGKSHLIRALEHYLTKYIASAYTVSKGEKPKDASDIESFILTHPQYDFRVLNMSKDLQHQVIRAAASKYSPTTTTYDIGRMANVAFKFGPKMEEERKKYYAQR